MFWSGNHVVVRELNSLLKEENVTLSQVLEADDILQECKADNKALMQFLTRPDILAELITLITEEPPASVELSSQYRLASIACEVLTSPLSSLSDRLSLDTQQMNRLCDFINRDPPLNPLLASYFSKTIEMLLERNPKQDWYLYHIVSLRVLDFFKSRRDFLPNLLRHISTSAVADTFKYFIRLDDLFNKIVMEWLEEHQFIECLIGIICGTWGAEGASPAPPAAPPASSPERGEKGAREPSEKHNHTGDTNSHDEGAPEPRRSPSPARRARSAAVASANACALLCDLVATGCAAEGAAARSRTSWALVARLAGGGGVRALLQAVFTSAGPARAAALVHGARLLRRLLEHQPALGSEGGTSRSQVELAVAPHLPLLHQALLRDPATYAQEDDGSAETGGVECGARAVGAARVQTAALLAHLAASEVEEVSTTMLTLGTPAVLVEMFFRYPHNNFLHAQLVAFCRNAFANPAYRTQYASHLLLECDLLTRLMDAFEENENKESGPRAGYMGHVTLVLSAVCNSGACECVALPAPLAARWDAFADKLEPALHYFATPLGGSYPSENSYEVDNSISDMQTEYYDAAAAGAAESAEYAADGLGLDDDEHKEMSSAKNRFLELADQRFEDDMWDDAPEADEEAPAAALREVLGEGSPWGSESPPRPGPAPGGEGWAQFETMGAAPDPFAHYWPYEGDGNTDGALDAGLLGGRGEGCVSLATNLLTAMSGMSPADVANIVNANIDLRTLPHADLAATGGRAPDARLSDGPLPDGRVTDVTVKVDGEESSIMADTIKITDPFSPAANVTNAPVNVTSAFENVTDAFENVTDAFEDVTDAFEDVTDAFGNVTDSFENVEKSFDNATDALVTDTSINAPELPIVDSEATAQGEPSSSSNLANSSASSVKEAVSRDSQETKDLDEISDKFNEVSLQDKSDNGTNSTADVVLDTKVLESTEALEAAER